MLACPQGYESGITKILKWPAAMRVKTKAKHLENIITCVANLLR